MTKPWARGSTRVAEKSSSSACRSTRGHCRGRMVLSAPAEWTPAMAPRYPSDRELAADPGEGPHRDPSATCRGRIAHPVFGPEVEQSLAGSRRRAARRNDVDGPLLEEATQNDVPVVHSRGP